MESIGYSEQAVQQLERLPHRLSTAQAAEYSGIPAATLRFWRHRGDVGPASYTLGGKKVVYDLEDLEVWLAEQKKSTLRGGVG